MTRVKRRFEFFIALSCRRIWGNVMHLSQCRVRSTCQIAAYPNHVRTLSNGAGMPERYRVTKFYLLGADWMKRKENRETGRFRAKRAQPSLLIHFAGLLQISDAPAHNALAHIGE